MGEKNPKEIIKENAFFLKNNIVPSEVFWKRISRDNILPETMLTEVRVNIIGKRVTSLLRLLRVFKELKKLLIKCAFKVINLVKAFTLK